MSRVSINKINTKRTNSIFQSRNPNIICCFMRCQTYDVSAYTFMNYLLLTLYSVCMCGRTLYYFFVLWFVLAITFLCKKVQKTIIYLCLLFRLSSSVIIFCCIFLCLSKTHCHYEGRGFWRSLPWNANSLDFVWAVLKWKFYFLCLRLIIDDLC